MLSFSIITPSFNQAEFIERTILSVLNQEYDSFEHWIIDGASTDGTIEILRRYPHLRWISEPDGGQGHAVNKGFARATGDILGWLNSDDTYAAGAFEEAAAWFERDPELGMVYGSCTMMDVHDRVLEVAEPPDWNLNRLVRARYSYIPNPTVFLRRDVVSVVGGVDETLRYVLDYDFFVRAGQRFKVARIPSILGAFRHHLTAKSYTGEAEIRRELNFLWDRYYLGNRIAGSIWRMYGDSRRRIHVALWERRLRRRLVPASDPAVSGRRS